MSVENSNASESEMVIDDSKIAYKRLLMDTSRLRFSVYTLKQSPFRVATLCLGVFCVLLVAGLIGQSASYGKAQQESKNKLQNVNAEKDGLQKSLTNLQKEKGKLEERHRELEERTERTTRRSQQVQSAYNNLAREANDLRETQGTLRSTNSALTKQLQQLNTTMDKLKSDNAALSTGNDLFQVELTQAKKLKTTLEENYKVLKMERNNLQNSFNNVTRFKDQLQLSYNGLMTDVEALEKRLHISSIEIDQAQTGHMDATTAKNALQEMYNLLVKATEQLNSSYNDLLKEKQELETSCSTVLAERNVLMEANRNLTVERDQLNLDIVRLNSTIAAKRCPSSWRSFMYSCYFTSSSKKSWKNSREYCKTRGADLAIITSREEMVFINGLYSSDKEVWIGLTDDGVEGHWTWVDGTPLNPNVTFWGNGQPNSYDGRNQDCVEFWHRSTGNGEWNDESCKIEQYFICEQ